MQLAMFNQKPKDYQKLFLDMDSFFASVEQQVNPQYRKKPVGIAPYTGNTGCVISASKEAKKLGIKTGTLVGEAKQRCPNLVILESRPALYHLYHQEIIKALYDLSPFLKILSIDEMTIRLTKGEQGYRCALKIALEIKNKIKEKVGDFLTCSVGVGPNQFLAKVAAESKKPDGLAIVELSRLTEFYRNLRLLDLPGININMERILNYFGIKTALDFYKTDIMRLKAILHHPGKVWYFRLRGYEIDEVETKIGSLGHSFVLPPQYRNKQATEKVIIKLATKIGYRLRAAKLSAAALSLSIKFEGNYARVFCKMPSTSNSHEIIRYALHLFSKIYPVKSDKVGPPKAEFHRVKFNSTPFFVYLNSFNLKPHQKQRSFFPQTQKLSDLSQAMDKINDKYGAGTITPASLQDAEDAAPDRIPFGKPRYEIRYKNLDSRFARIKNPSR